MPSRPRLRIVTMNILGHPNPDWERRRPLLAATLRGLDADVVALQEVQVDGGAGVEELLGPGWTVTPFERSSEGDGIGGAVATRAPHRVVAQIDQRLGDPGTTLPWCATTLVQLDTSVGSLLVVHHKPSWQFGLEIEREQQAVRAAMEVEDHLRGTDAQAVVLGDFDATPDAASLRFWRGRQSLDGVSVCYQDAWDTVHPGEAGLTFAAENPLVAAGEVATAPGRRIDHVLVRSGVHGPGLRIAACERVLDGPVEGVWASDHFGLVVDLELPDHEPGSWAKPSGRGGNVRAARGLYP